MTRNRSWCLAAGIVLAGVLAFVFAAGLYYYFVVAPRMLEQKRAAASAPTIVVHAPLQGESVPEGALLSTSATASGRNPIVKAQLWWDGQLYQQQAPDSALLDISTTFQADSSVKMTAGTHLLYWRAVDSSGLVAQSPSIAVTGTPREVDTEVVRAEEGQSLQDIAGSLGGDADVLADLNPTLGTGRLAAGTEVTVPRPDGEGGQKPSTGVAGDQQPQGGGAWGQEMPKPGAEAFKLLPAAPGIDFGRLLPILLSSQPAAPSNLQAGFEPCKIRLTWTDNATNEDGFDIWLQLIGSAPYKVSSTGARPGTGDATFEFPAPRFGIYAVWVEAVNSLGRQTSEIQGVFVDDNSCPQEPVTQLEIQVVAITATGGGWHDLYCFVSIEGTPERRVPEDDSQFIQPGALLGGTNLIVIDIPVDGELNLSGDCWGWPGPGSMGTFGTAVPSEQWDNRPVHAAGPGYDIEFRVRPFGSVPVQGRFSYTDADLLVPRVVSVEAQTSRDPLERSRLARNVMVTWSWDLTSRQNITNFVIAMDEAMEFRWANLADRTASIVLPSTCGGSYKFAVAAVAAGGARSEYSPWYEYQQPACDVYAQVDFLTFEITAFDDNEFASCDEAELIFQAEVSSVNRVYREWQDEGTAAGGHAFPYGTSTSCHKSYHFTQFPLFVARSAPGQPDSFTVLVEPSTSTVNVYVQFQDMDGKIVVWDYDGICSYHDQIHVPYEQWVGYERLFSETCQDPAGGERDGTVQLNYVVKGYRAPQGP